MMNWIKLNLKNNDIYPKMAEAGLNNSNGSKTVDLYKNEFKNQESDTFDVIFNDAKGFQKLIEYLSSIHT